MPINMKKVLATLFAVALGLNLSAQTDYVDDWNPDADGDNNVGVSDLLALLSVFAENDDDDDGIWDSQDDCVGAYDECGVCNGEGIPEGYCTCSLVIDALGECGGDCASDSDGDGVCDEYYGPCDGLETVTFDEYTYDLIAIGDLCWFAENLRTEHYANGDVIHGELNLDEWEYTTEGAQAIYNNDASNLADYGRLYNWYAVDDARGLCLSGWHVPSDEEFMELEMELGMSEAEVISTGLRGTNQGTQLKSSPGDNPSWNGTNTTGFSGLAGGMRNYVVGVDFVYEGSSGYYWSSSPWGTNHATNRQLRNESTGVVRTNINDNRYGFSVRCVRD